jgi:hypothetical protein
VNDSIFRIAAVAAAAALLAAPYWAQIKAAASRALEAGKKNAGVIGRLAAAALLIAAAWGKVPLPHLPETAVRPVVVATPSEAMQRVVRPVADALRSTSAANRALWADLWLKAGIVASADSVSSEVVFRDTKALRDFTTLAVEIGWRRIGNNAPGTVAGLREAVEGAFASTLGTDVVPVTNELLARYDELAKALAWAGATR